MSEIKIPDKIQLIIDSSFRYECDSGSGEFIYEAESLAAECLSLNARWVRVEERLPEKRGAYLVITLVGTDRRQTFELSEWGGKGWLDWEGKGCVAWLDNVPEFPNSSEINE